MAFRAAFSVRYCPRKLSCSVICWVSFARNMKTPPWFGSAWGYSTTGRERWLGGEAFDTLIIFQSCLIIKRISTLCVLRSATRRIGQPWTLIPSAQHARRRSFKSLKAFYKYCIWFEKVQLVNEWNTSSSVCVVICLMVMILNEL